MSAARPVLVYDGRCAFCLRWVRTWKAATGRAVEYLPANAASRRFPQLTASQLAASVQLMWPDGQVVGGARAAFEALAAGGKRGLLWMYRRLPGFSAASEVVYRFVAHHRTRLGRLDRRLFERMSRARADRIRWTVLRALSLVYPLAFSAAVAAAAAAAMRLARRPSVLRIRAAEVQRPYLQHWGGGGRP